MFVESMSFPFKVVESAFWGGADEETRGRWVEGANENMVKEVKAMQAQDGKVELEFEGILGWAWKA